MPEQTEQLSDAEKTIQGEIHDLHQQRVDFEAKQHRTWRDGLTVIDEKLKDANERLNTARADRIKAAAMAHAKKTDRTPAPTVTPAKTPKAPAANA